MKSGSDLSGKHLFDKWLKAWGELVLQQNSYPCWTRLTRIIHGVDPEN